MNERFLTEPEQQEEPGLLDRIMQSGIAKTKPRDEPPLAPDRLDGQIDAEEHLDAASVATETDGDNSLAPPEKPREPGLLDRIMRSGIASSLSPEDKSKKEPGLLDRIMMGGGVKPTTRATLGEPEDPEVVYQKKLDEKNAEIKAKGEKTFGDQWDDVETRYGRLSEKGNADKGSRLSRLNAVINPYERWVVGRIDGKIRQYGGEDGLQKLTQDGGLSNYWKDMMQIDHHASIGEQWQEMNRRLKDKTRQQYEDSVRGTTTAGNILMQTADTAGYSGEMALAMAAVDVVAAVAGIAGALVSSPMGGTGGVAAMGAVREGGRWVIKQGLKKAATKGLGKKLAAGAVFTAAKTPGQLESITANQYQYDPVSGEVYVVKEGINREEAIPRALIAPAFEYGVEMVGGKLAKGVGSMALRATGAKAVGRGAAKTMAKVYGDSLGKLTKGAPATAIKNGVNRWVLNSPVLKALRNVAGQGDLAEELLEEYVQAAGEALMNLNNTYDKETGAGERFITAMAEMIEATPEMAASIALYRAGAIGVAGTHQAFISTAVDPKTRKKLLARLGEDPAKIKSMSNSEAAQALVDRLNAMEIEKDIPDKFASANAEKQLSAEQARWILRQNKQAASLVDEEAIQSAKALIGERNFADRMDTLIVDLGRQMEKLGVFNRAAGGRVVELMENDTMLGNYSGQVSIRDLKLDDRDKEVLGSYAHLRMLTGNNISGVMKFLLSHQLGAIRGTADGKLREAIDRFEAFASQDLRTTSTVKPFDEKVKYTYTGKQVTPYPDVAQTINKAGETITLKTSPGSANIEVVFTDKNGAPRVVGTTVGDALGAVNLANNYLGWKQRTTVERGQKIAYIKSLVGRTASLYNVTPSSVKIVGSYADLTPEERKLITNTATGAVRQTKDKSSIYIMADQIATPLDAIMTVKHEGAHFTLNRILGQGDMNEASRVLDRVALGSPFARSMKARLERQGVPKVDIMSDVFAYIYETRDANPGAWQSIRNVLSGGVMNKLGNDVPLTDKDIESILYQSAFNHFKPVDAELIDNAEVGSDALPDERKEHKTEPATRTGLLERIDGLLKDKKTKLDPFIKAELEVMRKDVNEQLIDPEHIESYIDMLLETRAEEARQKTKEAEKINALSRRLEMARKHAAGSVRNETAEDVTALKKRLVGVIRGAESFNDAMIDEVDALVNRIEAGNKAVKDAEAAAEAETRESRRLKRVSSAIARLEKEVEGNDLISRNKVGAVRKLISEGASDSEINAGFKEIIKSVAARRKDKVVKARRAKLARENVDSKIGSVLTPQTKAKKLIRQALTEEEVLSLRTMRSELQNIELFNRKKKALDYYESRLNAMMRRAELRIEEFNTNTVAPLQASIEAFMNREGKFSGLDYTLHGQNTELARKYITRLKTGTYRELEGQLDTIREKFANLVAKAVEYHNKAKKIQEPAVEVRKRSNSIVAQQLNVAQNQTNNKTQSEIWAMLRKLRKTTRNVEGGASDVDIETRLQFVDLTSKAKTARGGEGKALIEKAQAIYDSEMAAISARQEAIKAEEAAAIEEDVKNLQELHLGIASDTDADYTGDTNKESTHENQEPDRGTDNRLPEQGEEIPDGRLQHDGRGSEGSDEGRDERGRKEQPSIGRGPGVSGLRAGALRPRSRFIEALDKNPRMSGRVDDVHFALTEDAEAFTKAITGAKKGNAHGAFVAIHDLDDYKKSKLILSDNHAIGVAVTESKDIVSVFKDTTKDKSRNSVVPIIATAIEHGGLKGDSFGSKLTEKYVRMSVVPVSRTRFNREYAPDDWNYERDGEPDIVFWIVSSKSLDQIAADYDPTVKYTDKQIAQLPLFPDYNSAYAWRDSVIEEVRRDGKVSDASLVQPVLQSIEARRQQIYTDLEAMLEENNQLTVREIEDYAYESQEEIRAGIPVELREGNADVRRAVTFFDGAFYDVPRLREGIYKRVNETRAKRGDSVVEVKATRPALKKGTSQKSAPALESLTPKMSDLDISVTRENAKDIQKAKTDEDLEEIASGLTPDEFAWISEHAGEYRISDEKLSMVKGFMENPPSEHAQERRRQMNWQFPLTTTPAGDMTHEQHLKRAFDELSTGEAIPVDTGVIKRDGVYTAIGAALNWARKNLKDVSFDTVVGRVVIDERSVKDSFGHRYNQAKLDAVTSLPEGFANASYLGSMHDFDGKPIDNHYFAYPIMYNGERHIVFCRTRSSHNINRLYIHEVFLERKLKRRSDSKTAAELLRSKPHGTVTPSQINTPRGIYLYKRILQEVYSVNPENEGGRAQQRIRQSGWELSPGVGFGQGLGVGPHVDAMQRRVEEQATRRKDPTDTLGKKAYRALVDYMALWKEEIAKVGGVRNEENVYLMEKLQYGRKAHAGNHLTRAYFEPIKKILRDAGIDERVFNRYLHTRQVPAFMDLLRHHGIENENGAGMTLEEARVQMEEFARMPYIKELEKAAELVYAMNREVMEWRVAAGRISREQADAILALNPNYVPLKADPVIYGDLNRRSQGGRKGMDYKHVTTGHVDTVPDAPFTHSFMQALDTINANLANEKYATAADFIRSHPNPELWKIIDELPEGHTYDTDTGKVKTGKDLGAAQLPNYVQFREGGKAKYIVFANNDRGVLLAESLKGNTIRRFDNPTIQKVTRLFASLQTSLAPTFMIRNTIYDLGEAAINLAAEGRSSLIPKVVAGLPSAWKAVAQYNKHGTFRNEYAEEYFTQGGMVGFFGTRSFEEQAKEIRKAIGRGENVFAKGLKTLDLLNAIAETGTRLSVYEECRKDGMSAKEAMAYSKSITVDFNQKGTFTPWLNTAYMFSNVAIQSGVRGYNALTKGKDGKQTFAALVALGLIAGLLSNAFGDDDDDPTGGYKNVNEFEKTRSVLLPLGDGFLKLPIRGVYGALTYAGNKMADVMFGQDAIQAGLLVGENMLDQIDPLNGSGTLLNAATPSLLRPFIQQAQGVDWMGNDMYPGEKGRFGSKPIRRSAATTPTSWSAKAAAETLSTLTGGDAVSPGFIDLYPKTLQHWWDSISGGIGRDASTLLHTASKLTGNGPLDERKNRDILVRDFFHEPSGFAARVRKATDAAKEIINLEKGYKKIGRPEIILKRFSSEKIKDAHTLEGLNKNVNSLKAELRATKDQALANQITAKLDPLIRQQAELIERLI